MVRVGGVEGDWHRDILADGEDHELESAGLFGVGVHCLDGGTLDRRK